MSDGKLAEAKKISTAELRTQALELRRHGPSDRHIGLNLGISHQTAARYVINALEEDAKTERLKTEELRLLTVERINMARVAISQKVVKGDLQALDRWLRLNEQEIKLLGLDAPQKIEFVDGETAMLLEELDISQDELVIQLKAMLREKVHQSKKGGGK